MGNGEVIDLTSVPDDEDEEVANEAVGNDEVAPAGPEGEAPALQQKQEAEEASPGPEASASAGKTPSNNGADGTSGAAGATTGAEGDGSGGSGAASGGRSSNGGRGHGGSSGLLPPVAASTEDEEGRKTSRPEAAQSGSSSKDEFFDCEGQEEGLPPAHEHEGVLTALQDALETEEDDEERENLKKQIAAVKEKHRAEAPDACGNNNEAVLRSRLRDLRDFMKGETHKGKRERMKAQIAEMEANLQILLDLQGRTGAEKMAMRRDLRRDFASTGEKGSDEALEAAKGKRAAVDDPSSSSEEEEEEEEDGGDGDNGSEASSSGYDSEGDQQEEEGGQDEDDDEEDPGSGLSSSLTVQISGFPGAGGSRPGHAVGTSSGADTQPEQQRDASESPVEKRKAVQHEWLGREIMKLFPDGNYYRGIVDGYDPTQGKRGWWHVTYEDEDQEELGPIQVKKYLIPLEAGAQVQEKAAGRKAPSAGDDRSKYLLCPDIACGKEKVLIPVYNEVNGNKELPDFTYITEPIIGEGLKDKLRAAAASSDCLFLPIRTTRIGKGNRRVLENAVPEKARHCYDAAGRLKDWAMDWDYGITEIGEPKTKQVVTAGPKLPLEVFMTEKKGWGVRCRELIPSGTFICDYLGHIMSNDEAETLAGKDEYLFGLEHFHCQYVGALEDAEDSGVRLDKETSRSWAHRCKASSEPPVVDGLRHGNVARFINHNSTAPNCLIVSVLTDKEMHSTINYRHGIFAMDDIEPFTELLYNYGYHHDEYVPPWQDPNQAGGVSTAAPNEAPSSTARATEETADAPIGEAAPPRVSPKQRAAIETYRGDLFRGVYKNKTIKTGRPWACSFSHNGMSESCGMHGSAPEAARARDRKAVLFLGPEAANMLNFPLKDYARELEKYQRDGSLYGADLQKKMKAQLSDREAVHTAQHETLNSSLPDTDDSDLLTSRKNTSSAFKGVFWSQKTKMWRAQLYHKGQNIHLGSFATEKEAVEARKQAMRIRGIGAARKSSTATALEKNHRRKRKEPDHAGPKATGATGSNNKKRSRYKGVSWCTKGQGKWRVIVYDKREGKNHYIGRFASEMEAAMAYDEAAVRYRGPEAEVNFPGGHPQPPAADQVASRVQQSAPGGDEMFDAGDTGAEAEGEQQGVRSSAATTEGPGGSKTSGCNGPGDLSSGSGMVVPSNPSQPAEMDIGADVPMSVPAAGEEDHDTIPTTSLYAHETTPNGGTAVVSPGDEECEVPQHWYLELSEEGKKPIRREFDTEEEGSEAFDVMSDARVENQTIKFTTPGTRITIAPWSPTSDQGRPESSSNTGLHWGERIPETFDGSLVGRRVRIFWKGCGLWRDATVARWDQWKEQYAVEYQGSPPETEILELWNETVEWLGEPGGSGGGGSRVWQNEWDGEDATLGKGTRVCSDSDGKPRSGRVQGLLMASMRHGSEHWECFESPRYSVLFDDGGRSGFLTRKDVKVMMLQPHVFGTPRPSRPDIGNSTPVGSSKKQKTGPQ